MDFFLFQKDCRVSAMGFNSVWISCMYFQMHVKAKSFVCVFVNLKTYIKSSLPVLSM